MIRTASRQNTANPISTSPASSRMQDHALILRRIVKLVKHWYKTRLIDDNKYACTVIPRCHSRTYYLSKICHQIFERDSFPQHMFFIQIPSGHGCICSIPTGFPTLDNSLNRLQLGASRCIESQTRQRLPSSRFI